MFRWCIVRQTHTFASPAQELTNAIWFYFYTAATFVPCTLASETKRNTKLDLILKPSKHVIVTLQYFLSLKRSP